MSGDAPFVPQRFAGETLYSFIARYRRLRMLDDVALDIDLFGKDVRVFSPTLPSMVARIASRMGIGRPGAEGLALGHTAFLYYIATATDDLPTKLMAEMLSSEGSPVMLAGQRGAPVGLLPFMRFCPDCLAEMERDGETQWRLVHQLPIVTFCPQHDGPLRESTIPGTGIVPGFFVPSAANCPAGAKPAAAAVDDPTALRTLSRAAAQVAARRRHVADWRPRMLNELDRRGLVTAAGRLRWSSVIAEVNNRLDLVAGTFPSVRLDPDSRQDWVGLQFRPERQSSTDRVLMLLLAFGLLA